MWFLFFITIINAVASKDFINSYRVTAGFAMVTSLDIAIAFGFVYALFVGGNQHRAYPSARTHPILLVILVLMWLGFVSGWLQAALEGTRLEWSLRNAREYVVWPISVIVGY